MNKIVNSIYLTCDQPHDVFLSGCVMRLQWIAQADGLGNTSPDSPKTHRFSPTKNFSVIGVYLVRDSGLTI